jgi:hypothetical protein
MKDTKQFEGCNIATICIFPGQLHSNLPVAGDTVFHYNIGINVIVVDIIKQNLSPVDCELLCDGTCHEPTPDDCDDCKAEQDRCDPDPIPAGMKKAIDAARKSRLSEFVDNMINNCDNCQDASPDNCDGCLGNTGQHTLAEYAEGEDDDDNADQRTLDHVLSKQLDNEGMPPKSDQNEAFGIMTHELQHLECRRLGLANNWVDMSNRCIYQTKLDGDCVCNLNFAHICNFKSCRRIGND